MISRPDDKTKAALRRLSQDSDFQEVMAWLEYSLVELDQANRFQVDAIVLRQQQGGSQTIAALLDYAHNRKTKAIAVAPINTRQG